MDARYMNSQMLNIDLAVNGGYQRPLDESKVQKILKEFNPCLVNPIKVNRRDDGTYWVIDGQHTLEVLRRRNGGDNTSVLCTIRYGLTREEERLLFLEQNGLVKALTVYDRMNAELAGNIGDSANIKYICERNGFTLERSKKDNSINAIGAITSIYKRYGASRLNETLFVLRESYNGESTSLQQGMLYGLSGFLDKYDTQIKEERLIMQLRKTPVYEIVRNSKLYSGTLERRFGYAIFKAYNETGRGYKKLANLY